MASEVTDVSESSGEEVMYNAKYYVKYAMHSIQNWWYGKTGPFVELVRYSNDIAEPTTRLRVVKEYAEFHAEAARREPVDITVTELWGALARGRMPHDERCAIRIVFSPDRVVLLHAAQALRVPIQPPAQQLPRAFLAIALWTDETQTPIDAVFEAEAGTSAGADELRLVAFDVARRTMQHWTCSAVRVDALDMQFQQHSIVLFDVTQGCPIRFDS